MQMYSLGKLLNNPGLRNQFPIIALVNQLFTDTNSGQSYNRTIMVLEYSRTTQNNFNLVK
jgi:hypothetical protein